MERINATANYLQQQTAKISHGNLEYIKGQIMEKEFSRQQNEKNLKEIEQAQQERIQAA